MQRKKRVIALQHLMHWFEPEQSDAEREVNDILRRLHEDVATLRRELVDLGHLRLVAAIYWWPTRFVRRMHTSRKR